ncbi:MAG: 3-dehydroquinate synthase family protein [Acidobacteriota bacterium]
MITIEVTGGATRYPYRLQEGLLGDARELLAPIRGDQSAFVVTDTTVGPLYGEAVADQLDAPCLAIPPGEDSKRWPTVEGVVNWLVTNGAERRDVVVAVGGGVVTDIVGFAAAITLRGLPWAAVPTTLLGMVDAAVGGKTGVDLDLGKNLIGCFWAPRLVLADPLALLTLDPREVRAGLAEVVKAAMIAPSQLEHLIDSHLAAAAGGDVLRAKELIVGAVRVKADVVSLDERESGPRATLNLGHTLAHALEAATGYQRLLHGEAVAWGLLAELRLARDGGLIGTADAQMWAARLEALEPLPRLRGLVWEQVAPFIARDKKRSDRRVEWVLPRLGGVVMGVDVAPGEAATVLAELAALEPGTPLTALF